MTLDCKCGFEEKECVYPECYNGIKDTESNIVKQGRAKPVIIIVEGVAKWNPKATLSDMVAVATFLKVELEFRMVPND